MSERDRARQRAYREADPEKKRAYERAYYQRNRERMLEQRRAERLRNADRVRETNRVYRQRNAAILVEKERNRRYGITPERLARMLAEQNHRCGVCGDEFDSNPKHRHIDHDHSTGRIRGILCRYCNHGLGNAKDSPERLRAMIAYLEKHQS